MLSKLKPFLRQYNLDQVLRVCNASQPLKFKKFLSTPWFAGRIIPVLYLKLQALILLTLALTVHRLTSAYEYDIPLARHGGYNS